jgi:hypothetical protein
MPSKHVERPVSYQSMCFACVILFSFLASYMDMFVQGGSSFMIGTRYRLGLWYACSDDESIRCGPAWTLNEFHIRTPLDETTWFHFFPFVRF